MNKLVKTCEIGIISIWIVVFLVRCGKSAPSSVSPKYTHDANAGLKKKRSADFMDILSNMLLDHSGDVSSEWPNYDNDFDNDYQMDDWMANEIPQTDYDHHSMDYNDVYGNIGFRDNVDINPPDSLDYSCPEEENNDVVPFVESGYHYNKRPGNSDWSSNDGDFVVLKPGVENTYGHIHENEWGYGTNAGPMDDEWKQMPSHGTAEIEEMLWKQFDIHGESKPTFNSGLPPPVEKRNSFGKEAKFNIFTCLSEPHQPEHEIKNIADEYFVLLIKKDHILGGKNENNAPVNTGTATTTNATPTKGQEKTDTTEKPTAVVSTTASNIISGVHPDVIVRPIDGEDCNTTESPVLSATNVPNSTTYTTEVPSPSTVNTVTVIATEKPSTITVHVPNGTTTTERPFTTTPRTSTIVVTSTTERPSRNASYIPSSTITTKTTAAPPAFTISVTNPTFATTTTERLSTTAATITGIPDRTTNPIESYSEGSSTLTIQSPSTTTYSVPITIVGAITESPSKSTRLPDSFTAVADNENSHSTTSHSPTRSADTDPDTDPVVGVSKDATDRATTEFSKPTTDTSTTEKSALTTVTNINTITTIRSTADNASAATTLPPTTVAPSTTEMPPLSTTHTTDDSTNLEVGGMVGNLLQEPTTAPAQVNTDANNLEDINGDKHQIPTEKLVGHLIKLKRSLQQIQPTIEELLSHAETDQTPPFKLR